MPETPEERIAKCHADSRCEVADQFRRGLAWLGFFIGLGIALTNPEFLKWLP